MTAKLTQLLNQRRAEYRKQLHKNNMPLDPYVQSVKVDFVAVLERHFHKMGDAA